MPEPKRSQLRRLLDRPDASPRVRKAVAGLLGVWVVAIGAIGFLVIWHLVRRGRLIRERLNPPRHVRLPDLDLSHRRGNDAGLTHDPERGSA